MLHTCTHNVTVFMDTSPHPLHAGTDTNADKALRSFLAKQTSGTVPNANFAEQGLAMVMLYVRPLITMFMLVRVCLMARLLQSGVSLVAVACTTAWLKCMRAYKTCWLARCLHALDAYSSLEVAEALRNWLLPPQECALWICQLEKYFLTPLADLSVDHPDLPLF